MLAASTLRRYTVARTGKAELDRNLDAIRASLDSLVSFGASIVLPDTGVFVVVINVKDAAYGAKGDGVTDDTAAIKLAVAAMQAAAAAGFSARLYFPSGVYLISGEIVFVGITGGMIMGDARGQTTILEKPGIQALGGARGFFVRVNCQRLHICDMTFWPQNHFGTLSGGAASGQPTINVLSWGYGTPIVGQRVAVVSSTYAAMEVGTVASVTSTSVTLFKNLEQTWAGGDHVVFGPLGGVCDYSDQTLAGAQISTQNECARITVGNPSALTTIGGFAVTCKGGGPVLLESAANAGQKLLTVDDAGQVFVGEQMKVWDDTHTNSETITVDSVSGNTITAHTNLSINHVATNLLCHLASLSDGNNDEHCYSDCVVLNACAGWYIEGNNALSNKISRGAASGSMHTPIWATRGGSCDVDSLITGAVGFEVCVGGPQHHPWTLRATAESNSGLVRAASVWGAQSLTMHFLGYDKKGGPNAGTKAIDVTGYQVQLYAANCSLDFTGDIYTKDLLAGAFASSIEPGRLVLGFSRLQTTQITCDGMSVKTAFNIFASNAVTYSLSNGAVRTSFGDDGANGAVTPGALEGVTTINANAGSGITITNPVDLESQTTGVGSPAAGGAGALPATPAGYLTVKINGTNRQLPYY